MALELCPRKALSLLQRQSGSSRALVIASFTQPDPFPPPVDRPCCQWTTRPQLTFTVLIFIALVPPSPSLMENCNVRAPVTALAAVENFSDRTSACATAGVALALNLILRSAPLTPLLVRVPIC